MEFETILINKSGPVAIVSLNRINQRNAINTQMLQEISKALLSLEQNNDVRVIIIKSACEGVFSAGADIKERDGMSEKDIRNRRRLARDTYELIQRIEKPLICAVNGKNYGGGFEIAASCDFIITSENASFCLPEVRWGTLGATQRLTRLVGKNMAKYFLLTSKIITAKEAFEFGLSQVLIPESQFEETVSEISKKIAGFSPLSVKLTKKCVDVGVELDMVSASQFEIQAIETLIASNQWKQGVGEFLSKEATERA